MMHDAARMERRQGAGQLAGNGQHYRQGQTRLARQHVFQALAGEGLQDQSQVCTVLVQGNWFEDLGGIEGLQQGIFVPQAIGSAVTYGEFEKDDGAVLNMPSEVEHATGCDTYLLNDLIVAHIYRTSMPEDCADCGDCSLLLPAPASPCSQSSSTSESPPARIITACLD